LGLLVMAFMIYFTAIYVYPKVMDYMKQLPDYKQQGDSEIDISNLSDEQIRNLCPNWIAKVADGKIKVCFGEKCSQRLDTSLLWVGGIESAEIKVDIPWTRMAELRFKNVKIGSVINGRIRIDEPYLKLAARDSLPELPPINFLNLLNGSYYYYGNNICRKDKIVSTSLSTGSGTSEPNQQIQATSAIISDGAFKEASYSIQEMDNLILNDYPLKMLVKYLGYSGDEILSVAKQNSIDPILLISIAKSKYPLPANPTSADATLEIEHSKKLLEMPCDVAGNPRIVNCIAYQISQGYLGEAELKGFAENNALPNIQGITPKNKPTAVLYWYLQNDRDSATTLKNIAESYHDYSIKISSGSIVSTIK
jgi:hypothetical protein